MRRGERVFFLGGPWDRQIRRVPQEVIRRRAVHVAEPAPVTATDDWEDSLLPSWHTYHLHRYGEGGTGHTEWVGSTGLDPPAGVLGALFDLLEEA